jgi:WD40 repeat protein
LQAFRLYAPSPSGQFIVVLATPASAGATSPLIVWDLLEAKPFATLPDFPDGPRAMAWHPTRQLLAGHGWWDGGFVVLDLADRKNPRQILAEPGNCSAIGFLPDGRLVTGYESGELRLWDVASGQQLSRTITALPGDLKLIAEEEQVTITEDSPSVSSITVSADGRTVAVGTVTGTVIFFDVM